EIFGPLPNQMAEFIWNGLDHLGRQVRDSANASVRVGFVYDGVYYIPGDFTQSFGLAGSRVTGIPARQEFTYWKVNNIALKPMAKRIGLIADGWTVSIHHQLSPIDPSTLQKGDGTTVKNKVSIIKTVAGNGTDGFSGDGGPATEAQLDSPTSVTVDSSGNLFIADSDNFRIRKVDPSGIITTVAGNGTYGYSGDGGPATEAQLSWTYGVAVDASGNMYIVDTYNQCIRKVDASGIITTVAGDGISGYNGDGIPATGASLNYPYSVAVDTWGNLYIDDMGNYRIRKVDPSGIITTVAGDRYGCDGDGGPAMGAGLKMPRGITVDAWGNLYVVDRRCGQIRKVDTSGIITTVAGSGVYGGSGDGGPATEASLSFLESVAVDPSGNVYITQGRSVGRVAPPFVLMGTMTLEDILFAEESRGYIMSGAGSHKFTVDLDRGTIIYEFGYDQNNNLVSITDRFSNKVSIEREPNGVPTAIISPNGITTRLTVDANNQLTRIIYPDGNFFGFEYTSGGLMTAEIDPEGNRFEHQYDSIGRLTNTTDDEGGHWHYSRLEYENGDVLGEVLSAEGSLTSHVDHTYSTGAYTSTIIDPTGAETGL
ncbi:MAG: hypothetical protein JRC93_12420, partial [Deltaproteobacteria bacterium]|nr:hypothetical protein [Deltaproteobacteria bacterium]